MGIAAVGNNLITYVLNEMHYSLSRSANIVTNFIGTLFILALLGGFLSDSYLGCFWTMLIFGFLELSVSYLIFSCTHGRNHHYTSGLLAQWYLSRFLYGMLRVRILLERKRVCEYG